MSCLRSMWTAAIRRFVQAARPSASVDRSWSGADLLAQLCGWSVALVRAQVVLLGTRGNRFAFVERGVSIAGRRHLQVGRGLVLERGVHLRAYGTGGLQIGAGVTIGRYSVVEVSSGLAYRRGRIQLGDGVGISDHCFLGGAGGLAIGKHTIIGQGVSFHPQNHGTLGGGDIKSRPLSHRGIVVGSGCWIGAGSRILDGVSIGDNAIIGAGSVVTRSVPSDAVAFGVPARIATSNGSAGD